MLFAWITDPNAWLALGTLTLLEIVLGIDNIIFLSLVVAKLPTAQRAHARRIGLMGAMVMRLALLASIAWVVKLTNPLFTVFGQEISFRDLILLLGGLFLIWKASKEIHESIEGEEEGLKTNVHSNLGAIVQIMPGRDGLVHISQIANERIANVGDYLKEGQQVRVKVLETDERGRIRLSIKAVLNEEAAAAAPAPSEAAAQ